MPATDGYRRHAAVEFPDAAGPEHRLAVAVKADVRERLARLCDELDNPPTGLADQLFLLIEGAYATAHTLAGWTGPGRSLPGAARALLGDAGTSCPRMCPMPGVRRAARSAETDLPDLAGIYPGDYMQ